MELKTQHGRKVLQIYDGYKSDLRLKELETLNAGNIISYYIASHKRGKFQPLDCGVFGSMKE